MLQSHCQSKRLADREAAIAEATKPNAVNVVKNQTAVDGTLTLPRCDGADVTDWSAVIHQKQRRVAAQTVACR